jgi:hypothetical protein
VTYLIPLISPHAVLPAQTTFHQNIPINEI